MLLGTDIASAMTTLEALRVDVIGLNCSTGPEHMREPVRYLARARDACRSRSSRTPACRSTRARARRSIRSSRSRWRGMLARVRRASSACASSAAAAARRPSISRRSWPRCATADGARGPRRPSASRASVRCVSSAMRAITLHQEPPPLLVGERVNSQGSRKVKRLLLADDYEGILDVAREQVGGRRARARRLRRAHRARRRGRADVEGRQAALDERRDAAHDRLDRGARSSRRRSSTCPGRAIINSINMENGRKRIDAVVPLAKKHGAALVALTIDEIGMAKTRERKLEVARDDLRHRRRRVRPRARGPDLRRAHVHARHRRRGVDRLARRRRSRASASSSASCRASSRSSACRT